MRYSIFVVAAALVAPDITAAAPALRPSELHQLLRHRQRDEECGFAGNPDMYGLGIRLGVYLQWISSLVVWAWYPDGGTTLMQTYLVFLFAIMIVVLVSTVKDTPIWAVEIVVLTYIIFGGVYGMVYQTFTQRGSRRFVEPSPAMLLAVYCLLSAATLYCAWFWFRGIHGHMLATPCGSYMFFFRKFSVYDPAITRFFGALSVLFSVLFVPSAFLYLRLRVGLLRRMDEARIRRAVPSHSLVLQVRGLFIVLSVILSIITCVYSIIAVELTLSWNSIRDVYTINTTGQLIPFIIGLTGFARCIYKSIEDQVRYPRVTIWSLLEHTLMSTLATPVAQVENRRHRAATVRANGGGGGRGPCNGGEQT
jgi:hypothetical protein